MYIYIKKQMCECDTHMVIHGATSLPSPGMHPLGPMLDANALEAFLGRKPLDITPLWMIDLLSFHGNDGSLEGTHEILQANLIKQLKHSRL